MLPEALLVVQQIRDLPSLGIESVDHTLVSNELLDLLVQVRIHHVLHLLVQGLRLLLIVVVMLYKSLLCLQASH